MLKHILVPLDGSALAEKALDYAVRIIAPKRRITLVSIVEIPDVASSFHPNVMMVEDYLASARLYLDRIASELRKEHQLRVDIEVKVGDPANMITNIAETEFVDAIVISTHGRTGVQRFIFGSVTQKVLNAMPCPVLVVPGKETVKSADKQRFGLTQQSPASS